MTTEIIKHSVSISGHRTSISLEKPFWDLFCTAAKERNVSINALISDIDERRQGNLSSAIRLFVLEEVLTGKLRPSP
ncbi:ribbon-helix-helix domain-containing protein [Sneathiella glossodoripedis]|uniref:ribbon-helix-helix domain-containing protein n=1 Tax=Sneathiella glossodoripedis TaxID=418853 RepID=UPI00046FC4A8|nr:ribbon-helix-helix domain-containing protein [Sneathiella glossodoripedis]